MNEQVLKTSGPDVLSSRKQLRKTLRKVAPPPPHPPLVRPKVKKENIANYLEFSFIIFLVMGFPGDCYSKYIILFLIQKHFVRPTMFNLNSEIQHWQFSFI